METRKADRQLVARIEAALAEPIYFRDVVAKLGDAPWRDVLKAWGDVRERLQLDRDEHGRYWRARKDAAAPV